MILSVAFLVIDAGVDTFLFDEEGDGYWSNLRHPEPMDLWMRGVVVCLMFGFSFYVRSLFQRLEEKTDALALERDTLEHRVAEATRDLLNRNMELEEEISARLKAESELKLLAATDPLTQVYNRRKFLEELQACLACNLRYKTGVAVTLCDIDHFKRINDEHGHDTGDAVLLHFANLLRQNTRESDTLARWGGEEFILLTPTTNSENATLVAEKLRQTVSQAEFGNVGRITASFGVALIRENETGDELLKRADQALYAAKKNGRNAAVLSE